MRIVVAFVGDLNTHLVRRKGQFFFILGVYCQFDLVRPLQSPRIVDAKHNRLAGESLDVPQSGKCELVVGPGCFDIGRLCGSVTSYAVMTESANWMIKRKLVVVDDALVLRWVAPKPTVLRARRVLDHDGPRFKLVAQLLFRFSMVSNGGISVLLLDDHFAIGNRADPAVNQPVDDPR